MLWGPTQIPLLELRCLLPQQLEVLTVNGLYLSPLLEIPSPNRNCLTEVLTFPYGINNDGSTWGYKSSPLFLNLGQCGRAMLAPGLPWISWGLCCNCITFQLLPLPSFALQLPQRGCFWEHFENKSTKHNYKSQGLFPRGLNLKH